MRGKALQIPDRSRHPLAAEAVERPSEQQVELAPRGAGEHRRELFSVLDALAAILVFDVFPDSRVAHAAHQARSYRSWFSWVLPRIVRRHPGVNGYPATPFTPHSATPSQPFLAINGSFCVHVGWQRCRLVFQ